VAPTASHNRKSAARRVALRLCSCTATPRDAATDHRNVREGGDVRRALILLTACAATTVIAPTVAVGAPPASVPNSSASANCIAMTSGVLFFRQKGIHLGADVSQFAANPPGGQASFNQSQLAKSGVECF
jgi:hypothetical protein